MLKKIGLKNYIKRILRIFNFQFIISVNGKNFKVLNLYGAQCKVVEPFMLDILKIIFQFKKGAFLDVGVNLGQTLLIAKSIDKGRIYFGFEPNTSCSFYVNELIRINKFKDTILIPVGLFNQDSIMQLNLYDNEITNSGGTVIKDYWSFNSWTVKRSIHVPLFTMHTLRNTLNLPDFDIIKIDVEGAELEVLNSLHNEIVTNKPIIIIEILSAYSKNNTIRYERQINLNEFIKNIDYKVIQIITNNNEEMEGLKIIREIDENSNPNHCNYILYSSFEASMVENFFKNYIVL